MGCAEPSTYTARRPLPTGRIRPGREDRTVVNKRSPCVNSIIYIVGLVVVVVAVLSFFGLR